MSLKCGHILIQDECRACRELQTTWYDKLITDGFQDAEDHTITGRPMRAWHRNMLSKTSTMEIQITHDYYEKALELLNSHHFKNEIHKRIWELHCEGLSRGLIEKEIANLKEAYKQSQIRNIIKDLEREINW